MRPALVVLAVLAFAALGALDCASGAWRTGVAALLLAAVNGLLLSAGN